MAKRNWVALGLGLLLLAGLTALRASDPYAVQVARETSFDVVQQWKPRTAPRDLPIRVIDIDEPSLVELGQWPWPRSTMASLATRLTELGAAVIAFDVLFSEPDRFSPLEPEAGRGDNDRLFADALAQAPAVLGMAQSQRGEATSLEPKSGLAVTGADPLASLPALGGATQPLPTLADAAMGIGIASLDRGDGGIARRLPLLWRNGGSVFPALSVEALRVAQGMSTLVVLGDESGAGTVQQVRIGDFTVPTGPNGDLRLYYRHLPPELYLSASEVLSGDKTDLAQLVAGHIVLVGASASGLLDIRASTLGTAVPGVSIHVQALEQMLTGTFLDRADWVGGLEMLVFAVAGIAIVTAVVFAGPITGLIVSVLIVGLLLVGSWWAFAERGLLVDANFSTLGAIVLYAAMAFFRFAITDADRRRVRRAFAHYVEPKLLSRIENDPSLLRLGGDERELTVMFSDVRNFSSLAERTTSSELVAILNRLLSALGSVIIAELGTIDKFMGDAVMAFWNAPVDVDRHALRACSAALAMRKALDQLNRTGEEQIAIGIGVATGPALVGNIGFEERFNYSCIGDTVNIASRVEGACKTVGYDILITAETADAAPELAHLPAGAVALKGMTLREPIHILIGDAKLKLNSAFAELQSAHAQLLEAFQDGADYTPSLNACRQLATSIDARLAGFYTSCLERLDDFLPVERSPRLVPDPA